MESVDELRLYEGLPHQVFEAEKLKKELETYNTVEVGGYPFYGTSINVSETDATEIVELLNDRNSIHPINLDWAKACGGFHPDYCVTWKVNGKTFYALLCFGCHEIEMRGGALQLHAEFNDDALSELEGILRRYRADRNTK